MSVTITPLRLALLVACLVTFWVLGGFTPIDSHLEAGRPSAKAHKAWFYCILAFVTGAICVSVIDHKVGLIDPTNLRFAYIIGGIALMILGILWHQSLVSGLEAIAN